MSVTYDDINSSYISDDTKSLQEYMPQEYISDDLSAIIQDNAIYISFYGPFNETGDDGGNIHIIPDEEMSKEVIEQFYEGIKENGCTYLDSCDAVYIMLSNNRLGFSLYKDGIATYTDDLGEKIYDVIEQAANDI